MLQPLSIAARQFAQGSKDRQGLFQVRVGVAHLHHVHARLADLVLHVDGAGQQPVLVVAVLDEADAPQDQHQHHRGRNRPQPDGEHGRAPRPGLGVVLHQPRFGEHHLIEQPVEEVGPPAALRRRRRLVEHLRDAAQQPVERRAFLHAAGQVEAAQFGASGVVAQEGALQEPQHPRAQGRHLRREAQDQAAAANVELLLQALGAAIGDGLDHAVELAADGRDAGPLAPGQGGAHHRPAPLHVQVVVELHEAGQQVGLGEHHIDRRIDLQRLAQLGQPAAHGDGMRVQGGAVGLEQFIHAQRHDDAIDRLQRSMLAQQAQEAAPGLSVGRAVGILAGVPAGGVHQHRLVGEPEVEVPGPADTFKGAVGKGKPQARVQEGRRLTGPGRADDHVPGAAVEIIALTPAGLA